MRNRKLVIKNRSLYAKAPRRVFQMGLTPFEVTIFFYLTSLDEETDPSLKNIADALDISEPTVHSSLTKLQELNMINKYHQGTIREVNKYEFTDWRQWKKIKKS